MKLNMKLRSTTPVSRKGLATKAVVVSAVALMTISMPAGLLLQSAYADRFDDQIAAIQEQRNQYDAKAANLSQKADTLANKKAVIQNQASAIQAQINQSQAKYNKLQSDIAKNQKLIDQTKNSLGQTIAMMYVNDSTTPLELLANSTDIGAYIDQQTYRSTIRDSLVQKINKINELKKQLEKQRAEVKQVLSDQHAQKQALNQKMAEYNRLISETNNQESAYRSLSKKGAAEQAKLRAQQQEELAARYAQYGGSNLVVSGNGGGGYPTYLANAPQDSLVDPWGMYNRECVSYVAWKVYQTYGHMPYWGNIPANAKNWPANAINAGYSTGTTPKVGSAGVIYGGPYGHIVWVDSINGNGTINISQYNYGVAGQFSRMYNVNPQTYDVFIYFR